MENKLDEARKIINDVDSKMAELFVTRMRAVEKVYEHKKKFGLPILDQAREDAVIQKNVELIEDEIFICDENNIYHISTQNKMGDSDSRLNQILHLWSTATEAIFNHLPLLILLTIPLLVLPMRRVLKKYNVPRPNLYILALFYVSLIELVVLALAIASIFVSDFNSTARLLLLAIPTLYLTTILRNTHIGSWWRALLVATFINFVYIASCAAIMFTLILTAVIYYYF